VSPVVIGRVVIAGVNTNTLLGYAQGIALVLCLVGFLLAAVAMVGQARSGLSSAGPWKRLLAAGIGTIAVGGAPYLLSIAFLGHTP
jgi:hypothetical protein